MRTNKTIALTLLLAFAVLLTACAGNETSVVAGDGSPSSSAASAPSESGSTGNSGDTFKLGQYLPLSGNNATAGQTLLDGTKLAIEKVNAAGGLNGQQIELVYYDTTSSTEEAAKITTKLVEVDKVDAVITTPMSTEILASAQTLMDNKVLTFALGTSPAVVKEEWDYLYRPALNNGYMMPVIFEMINKMGFENTAILYTQDETCIAMMDLFEEAAKAQNMPILAKESFDMGETDYSAQLTNILATNPQFVFFAVSGDFVGLCAKQIRQMGYDGLIVSRELFPENQIQVAGDATSYFCFANPYVTYGAVEECDIPIMRAFLEEYYAAYNTMPNMDWAYRGHDTIMVLWEASKIAGSNDPEALKAAMSQVKFEGLGGTMDFTAGHEGYSTFNTFCVMAGKNLLFDAWYDNGGYAKMLEETGRER